MNVERAVQMVWSLHMKGGRVLKEEDAENLVRLMILALGLRGEDD